MAIYHLTMKSGSKSAGGSAGKHSRYIMRTGPYADDNNELVYTYSANMPDFAESPSAFWDAADKYERSNGTVYREIEIGLPEELTLEQQISLAKEFAEKVSHSSDGDTPFTMAIHSQDPENKDRRHAHIMFSDRVVNDSYEKPAETFFKRYNAKSTERGGARKTEDRRAGRKVLNEQTGEYDTVQWTDLVRPLWQDYANAALCASGHSERIDCRTLEEQAAEAKETALTAISNDDQSAFFAAAKKVIQFSGPPSPKKGPVLTHAGPKKAPERAGMVIDFQTEKAKRRKQAEAEMQQILLDYAKRSNAVISQKSNLLTSNVMTSLNAMMKKPKKPTIIVEPIKESLSHTHTHPWRA